MTTMIRPTACSGRAGHERGRVTSRKRNWVTSGKRRERVQGQAVSGNFFSVMGATAFVGRTFEEGPRVPEAVLSYDFW